MINAVIEMEEKTNIAQISFGMQLREVKPILRVPLATLGIEICVMIKKLSNKVSQSSTITTEELSSVSILKCGAEDMMEASGEKDQCQQHSQDQQHSQEMEMEQEMQQLKQQEQQEDLHAQVELNVKRKRKL